MIHRAWSIEKNLTFKEAATTSRNTLYEKTSHYIILENEEGQVGIGECAPIYGLSPENRDDLLPKINEVVKELNKKKEINLDQLAQFPSLRFGVETALIDLEHGGKRELFQTSFTRGIEPIRINGLIWMSPIDEMKAQVKRKIDEGFHCIKLKIGSNDFRNEVSFIKTIRKEFGKKLEIRLDANGAFHPDEAPEKLKILSEFNIHSIEQPIKQGQREKMAELSVNSPIPIALDEELIGVNSNSILKLLDDIKPAYIILKPTLLGGMQVCQEWIENAEKNNIGWWVTSALESNIGLSAIAQWVSQFKIKMYQGLGTGHLYKNNFPSPLFLRGENLYYDKKNNWDFSDLFSE